MDFLKKMFFKSEEDESYQLNWLTYVSISVFIVLIFGFGDLLVLMGGYWPHLYGVAGVPLARWEEVVCYMPFANAFSTDNPLPIAPSYDRTLSGLSHMPFITMVLSGMIFKTLSLGNKDIYLLFCHSVLPMLNFWLIYSIYHFFLRKRWAILLAFFGIGYYSAFSSVGYFLNVFFRGGSFIEASPLAFPEISRTPFPGISLLLYLVAFYLTIRTKKVRMRDVLFLSMLWGLQVYVYFFNFISGLIFFILWIVYATYLTDRQGFRKRLLKHIGSALIVIFLIILPFLETSQNEIFKTLQTKLSSGSVTSFYVGNWGFILSYLLPSMLLVITFYFFRCDIYELFHRFTLALIGIAIDLFMGGINLFTDSISPALYQHRISGIFFRYFYFIPFLYFISIPYKRSSLGMSRIIVQIRDTPARYIHRLFYVYDYLIIIVGMIFISFVIVMGGVHNFENHQINVSQQMKEASAQLKAIERSIKKNTTVVLENIEANLLVPSLYQNTSLLSGSIINFVPDEMVLERLILYAKIYKWNKEEYLNFMLPSKEYANLNSYIDSNMTMDRELFTKGLGYWLYNFNKKLDVEALKSYKDMLSISFDKADISKLLSKHNVSAIVSRKPVLLEVPGTTVSKIDGYYITSFQ